MKFPTPGVGTNVVDVEFGVGHTGAITPVAIVKTVEVCGTNVSKVTLNNCLGIISMFGRWMLPKGKMKY